MWGTTKHHLVWLVLIIGAFVPVTASAVGLSPTTVDLWLEPSQEEIYELNVINDSEEVRNYSVQIVGIAFDEEDAVTFVSIEDGANDWFRVTPEQFELAAGEEIFVNVAIAPEQAASQVRVFGIQIVEDPDPESSADIKTAITSLLFLTVGTEVEQGAELLDFSLSETVVSQLPVTFFTTYRNVGDGILQPDGVVTVRNMFGSTVFQKSFNPRGNRLVPGQVRTFASTWEGNQQSGLFGELSPLKIGIYTVEIVVQPWEGSEEMSLTERVVFVPWRTGSLVLGLIVFVLFVRKYRKAVSI